MKKDSLIDTLETKLKKKGIIRRFSGGPVANVDVIPTGSLALDIALGVMGLPRGRIVEIYGPESGGKSTLALLAAINAQRLFPKETVGFIDAEHAMTASYSKKLGLDLSRALIAQPDYGEEGLEVLDAMIEEKLPLIVVDSVSALVPKVELDGEAGDAHIGLQARMMSQAMRRVVATISKSSSCVIFINQIREKIGVMFGSPEVTTGGRALRFAASVRLDVRRVKSVVSETPGSKTPVGNLLRVKVAKNKVAPPFREAEFNLIFGEGVDTAQELLSLGSAYGVIQVGGAVYKDSDGRRLAVGRDKMLDMLRDNVEEASLIRNKIIEKATASDGDT